MRVIINADDCGYSAHVNKHIKEAIESGKLTSTTIMANQNDVEGGLMLYEEYHKDVSFGIHLNLTEGEPLLKSKILLDYGYYSEKEGKIVLNSKRAESFRYKRLPKEIKGEIYKELSAQITKLRQGGVKLSHLDSHHHIHTCFSLIDVMAQLSKEFDIPRMRRIRNYVPRSLSFYGRQVWAFMSRYNNKEYIMTDFFATFKEFFLCPQLPQLKESDTLELMIHPGNSGKSYQEEELLMFNMVYPDNFELINYNNL